MTDDAHESPSPATSGRRLSNTAIGAVVALVRVAELYDPAVAHRAVLRARVADRIYRAYSGPRDTVHPDSSVVIATAALADIDLIISQPENPDGSEQPTRSLLSSTLVGRLDGLDDVATALEHYREHWDGTGVPSGVAGRNIVLAARMSALAGALVGTPAAGFVPSWHHGRRRVSRLDGTFLDPLLCSALDHVDLDDITAPPLPASAIQALLEPTPHATPTSDPTATATATTIRSAVALAGRNSDLLNLFASNAQRALDAAEVLILRSTSTQLDPSPVTRVDDGNLPALDPSRLDDLFEFSTQAELRAGVTIARDTTGVGTTVDEVIVPIIVGEETWGALVATRRRDEPPFDDHDRELLTHITNEMAEAIESTTHWAEMERMALRDQLTGLGNRHELYRELDAIFARPPAERIDTALIMCDVDGLKVVNDTLGHHAGDRLLIDAAAALKGAVRDSASTTVCRIGGDEFCMVIDGGALLTAHEISDTIERLFERSAGSGPARSISCGIAFADEKIDSRSSLLRAADENQYETKRARKNGKAIDVLALDSGSQDEPGDRRALRD